MSRDPRVDPRPGDVVLQGFGRGRRANRTVEKRDGDHVWYSTPMSTSKAWVHIDYWRSSTRNATILHTVEAPDAD